MISSNFVQFRHWFCEEKVALHFALTKTFKRKKNTLFKPPSDQKYWIRIQLWIKNYIWNQCELQLFSSVMSYLVFLTFSDCIEVEVMHFMSMATFENHSTNGRNSSTISWRLKNFKPGITRSNAHRTFATEICAPRSSTMPSSQVKVWKTSMHRHLTPAAWTNTPWWSFVSLHTFVLLSRISIYSGSNYSVLILKTKSSSFFNAPL